MGLDEDNSEVDASQGNGLNENDSNPKVDAPAEKEKVWKCDADESGSAPHLTHTGTHLFSFFFLYLEI